MGARSLMLWSVSCFMVLFIAGSSNGRPPDYADISFRGHLAEFGGVISCQNGIETLQLQINPERYGAGRILVVPGNPTNVTVAWNDALPSLEGRYPSYKVRNELSWLIQASRATQLYTLPYDNFLGGEPIAWSAEPAGRPDANDSQTRHGFRCERIFALQPLGLVDELLRLNIKLSTEQGRKLFPYANGRHCFIVISAVGPPDEPTAKGPAISIVFPSAEPLIPLHLEYKSPYVNDLDDELFQIMGYVTRTSELPAGIPGSTFEQLRYYRGWTMSGNSVARDVPYSRWYYQGEAAEVRFAAMSDPDFKIVDSSYAQLCTGPMPFFLFVAWTAICSYLSGGVAGVLSEGKFRGFRGVGLWNFGTILTLRFRLKSKWWVDGGMTTGRRWIFLSTFTVSYLSLCGLAGVWVDSFCNSAANH